MFCNFTPRLACKCGVCGGGACNCRVDSLFTNLRILNSFISIRLVKLHFCSPPLPTLYYLPPRRAPRNAGQFSREGFASHGYLSDFSRPSPPPQMRLTPSCWRLFLFSTSPKRDFSKPERFSFVIVFAWEYFTTPPKFLPLPVEGRVVLIALHLPIKRHGRVEYVGDMITIWVLVSDVRMQYPTLKSVFRHGQTINPYIERTWPNIRCNSRCTLIERSISISRRVLVSSRTTSSV